MKTGATIISNKIYIDHIDDVGGKHFYHLYSDGALIYTTSGNIIDFGGLLTGGEHRVGVFLFCPGGGQERVLFDAKVVVA